MHGASKQYNLGKTHLLKPRAAFRSSAHWGSLCQSWTDCANSPFRNCSASTVRTEIGSLRSTDVTAINRGSRSRERDSNPASTMSTLSLVDALFATTSTCLSNRLSLFEKAVPKLVHHTHQSILEPEYQQRIVLDC